MTRARLPSHGSAASLWGIAAHWEPPLEVTSPARHRRPGIRTHRCVNLARADRRVQVGVPVTSPARTLLEITPRLDDAGLTRAVNDSRLQGILHVAQLTELLERCPSHPGARRLRAVADPDPGRATRPTRSAFEDRFLAFAAEYGLPAPMVNARVNGYEVDALFVDQRVIVELDGWDFHGGRAAFERDRERDAAALASGHRTLRVTWERLHDEPDREAARLKAILDTQV